MRTIPPSALHMQITADISERHQVWQAASLCYLNFPAILTQLRRNIGQSQEIVHLLFCGHGEVLATLELHHAILRQVQPPASRHAPQCGQMSSRTSVVMQGAGELSREHGDERHPQPFGRDNDCGGGPRLKHLADFRLLVAEVHQARWIR